MTTEFELFVNAEKQAIEISKWLEGEKLKIDPGENFVKTWIQNHAKKFKEDWDKSCCKFCSKNCRYKTKKKCNELTVLFIK